MIALAVATVVFLFSIGGAAVGLWLRKRLPERYLGDESKDAVRVASGLIATLSALVLGLLVASAKSGFDAEQNGIQMLSANIVVLDRLLMHYGPEATPAREMLRPTVLGTIGAIWPTNSSQKASAQNVSREGESLFGAIRGLHPTDDTQAAIKTQSLQTSIDLTRTRWLLCQQRDNGTSLPFLAVLTSWLFAIFISFGLFSPFNRFVVIAFGICAVASASAMFLIVDLNEPSNGFIQVSPQSLQDAASVLYQSDELNVR